MAEIQVVQPAPPGGRFAPGVFDSQVGCRVPLRRYGETVCHAVLAAAAVAAGGSNVLLTLDLDGDMSAPSCAVSSAAT